MKDDLCTENQLKSLQKEHRELDKEVDKMEKNLLPHQWKIQLQIKTLKLQKLRLKERIEHLQKHPELLQKQ